VVYLCVIVFTLTSILLPLLFLTRHGKQHTWRRYGYVPVTVTVTGCRLASAVLSAKSFFLSPCFCFNSAAQVAMPELFAIPFFPMYDSRRISTHAAAIPVCLVRDTVLYPQPMLKSGRLGAYGSMWHQWHACMDTTPRHIRQCSGSSPRLTQILLACFHNRLRWIRWIQSTQWMPL
jgi:hypothetical protein